MKATPVSQKDAPEFIGQIIDVFEDFLESRHINIPNPEKTYLENAADDPVIIYGTDYGDLQNMLKDMLENWGIVAP